MATIAPADSARYMQDAVDHGTRALDLGQFVVDAVQRLSGEDITRSVTANCAYAGTVTLQLDDRDGNRRASAGDSITVMLATCGLPVMRRNLTGVLRIDLLASAADPGSAFQGRVTVLDAGLRVETREFQYGFDYATWQLQGGLDVHWAQTTEGVRLGVKSSPGMDLHFSSPALRSSALQQIDISQDVSHAAAENVTGMSYVLDYGTLGVVRVSTPLPARGGLHVRPRQLRMVVEGADAARISMDMVDLATEQTSIVAALVDRQGTVLNRAHVLIDPLTSWVRDVRRAQLANLQSDRQPAVVQLDNFRTGRQTDIDYLCQQQEAAAGADAPAYFADDLFQRPVRAGPVPTTQGYVARLQFSAPWVDPRPTWNWRFEDSAATNSTNPLVWSVEASVARYGALVEVRPVEPLRSWRNYVIETRPEGAAVDAVQVFELADGEVLTRQSGVLGVVSYEGRIQVFATDSDSGAVAADRAVRLTAQTTLHKGAALADYRWEQISGPALRLDSPLLTGVEAFRVDTAPSEISEAQVQLTVMTSQGDTDRVRFTVLVGDLRSEAAVMYLETRFGDLPISRHTQVGEGSFFYGPRTGQLSARLPALTEGGLGVSFVLQTADGGRVVPGHYTEVGDAPTLGPVSMSRTMYCDRQAVVGSFEILEAVYADDGRLLKLAVDFDQHCPDVVPSYARGSYRYHSDWPLRP